MLRDTDATYTSTSNKRKMEDTETKGLKLEDVDVKKLKRENTLMEKYNIVKGAMLEVVQKEVTNCLNFLCAIKSLNHDDEHVCVSNVVEDIIFCHVGLVQKYHMAYTMMKQEMADMKLRDQFVDLICKALVQRGIPSTEARRFSSIDVLLVLIGHSETYSQIFEHLRENLLTQHLGQPRQSENTTQGSSLCFGGNFGILNI